MISAMIMIYDRDIRVNRASKAEDMERSRLVEIKIAAPVALFRATLGRIFQDAASHLYGYFPQTAATLAPFPHTPILAPQVVFAGGVFGAHSLSPLLSGFRPDKESIGDVEHSVNRESGAKVLRLCALSPSSPPVPRYSREIRGLADGAALRRETLDGVEYLVVPVVAMVGDSVVWPMNATGPEFVPARELAVAPGAWNTRPVVMNHPSSGHGSAGEPRVLEATGFGLLFNTVFADGRLKTEAWLNQAKASKVPEASDAIARMLRGEMVEVSIGALVSVIAQKGSHQGSAYQYVWVGVIPDHLAILSQGSLGACSNSAGCGAPRMLQANNREDQPMNKRTLAQLWRTFMSSLGSTATSRSAEGESAGQIRRALDTALRAVEPGFDWVIDFWPDQGVVIYAVLLEHSMQYWRRTYTLGEGSEITLSDDRVEVDLPSGQNVNDWREVTAAQAQEGAPVDDQTTTPTPTVLRAASSAQPGAPSPDSPVVNNLSTPCSCGKIPTMDAKKKALIARIMSRHPGQTVTEEQLAQLPDPMLTSLAGEEQTTTGTTQAAAENPTTNPPSPPTTPSTPSTPPATPTNPTSPSAPVITKELALSALNLTQDELTGMQNAARLLAEQEAVRKTSLITGLKAKVAGTYTEAELQAMTVSDLEKLSKVSGVQVHQGEQQNYSGRPITGLSGNATSDAIAAPPNPWAVTKPAATNV